MTYLPNYTYNFDNFLIMFQLKLKSSFTKNTDYGPATLGDAAGVLLLIIIFNENFHFLQFKKSVCNA